MENTSLYFRTQLETKVTILPENINSDLDDNILEAVKTNVEGKLISSGIVIKVLKLISYDNCIIDKCNLQGSVVADVKYECFICSPVKNLDIICIVENIVKGYLICRNGPVICAIYIIDINDSKFKISGHDVYYGNKKIEKEDYLKASIINIRSEQGEKNIMTVCKLLDMATEEEIESFKEDQILATNGVANESREFI
jgi:DNA-directed RNA polymerase subunit E'/Rpb7